MKTNKKILIKIIFMLVVLFTFFNVDKSYATNGISLKKMEEQASNFISTGANQSTVNVSAIAGNFVSLGQILTFIGAGVLIGVTAYMGIKYLTAGPEAQAKLKVQLIGVVVSGITIFGAYGIWKLVINIASQLD